MRFTMRSMGFLVILVILMKRGAGGGRRLMVNPLPSKQVLWVRFPSPAHRV
jgi:hypothetical protein